ncbi:MAG: ABC transporter ATP-binding protein [Oligoflexia bacterium]|nr:ABC transporter ATP-binding protein [Oligoflexia bacterium]
MSESVLSVKNIRVKYGNIEALKGVSFEVNKGEIISLIGANGAGKSTTLRTISGLLKPVSGEILFEGKPIHGMKAHEIVRLGLLQSPEGRGIFANLTVLENLEMGAYTRKDSKAEINKDLEYVYSLFPRVKERLKQQAGTLSGGEQQMLAMSRALMGKPKLLLLDEPSLGLAPQIVDTIFNIIRKINKEGTTILLVEQNAHQALNVSHRGYVVETGEIVLTGPGKELLTNSKVREAYLGG